MEEAIQEFLRNSGPVGLAAALGLALWWRKEQKDLTQYVDSKVEKTDFATRTEMDRHVLRLGKQLDELDEAVTKAQEEIHDAEVTLAKIEERTGRIERDVQRLERIESMLSRMERRMDSREP